MFKKIMSLLTIVTFVGNPIVTFAQSINNQISQEDIIVLLTEYIASLQENQEKYTSTTEKYILQQGARGQKVLDLQNFLVSQGVYPEAIVSGYYGSLTEKAVQRLRTKYNLVAYRGFSSEIYSVINNKNQSPQTHQTNNADYKQWITNRNNIESYKTNGELQMKIQQIGRADTFNLELQYEVKLGTTDAEMSVYLDGEVELTGLLALEIPFKAQAIYKNDIVYLRVDDAPKDLLDKSLMNQWFKIDLEEISDEFGIDFEEVKELYTQSYNEFLAESEKSSDLVRVTKSTQQNTNTLENYSSRDSIIQYNAQVNTNAFLKNLISAAQEQGGESSEVTIQAIKDQEANYKDFFEQANIHIWVLDNQHMIKSEVNFNGVITGQEKESFFGKYKDPDIAMKLHFSEEISDIDKPVSINTPRNTDSVEDLMVGVERSIDNFLGGAIQSSRSQATNAKNINSTKQMVLAMELSRNQLTGDFPTGSRTPAELTKYLNPIPQDVEWEDNRKYPSKFCVWSKLEDSDRGKYFVASQSGSHYADRKPTSVTSCGNEKTLDELNNLKNENIAPVTSADLILGSDQAEIFVVEYSDLECPFCDRYHKNVHNPLVGKYGTTGDVAHVFRHFPLDEPFTRPLHPTSYEKHLIGQCVADLRGDKAFFNYKKIVFEEIGPRQASVSELLSVANRAGASTSQVQNCYDNGDSKDRVARDFNEGVSSGVQGTPTIYLQLKNGTTYQAVPDYAALRASIDAYLSNL